MDNLQARRSGIRLNAIEQEAAIEKDDIAITPLAVPVLAGPAGITTVILLSQQATDMSQWFVLAGVIMLIFLLVFVALRLAAVYSAVLGEITMRLIVRIMGLLLAAIAVQFILSGIQAANLI
jgi:multiple antibiotic resistance protein